MQTVIPAIVTPIKTENGVQIIDFQAFEQFLLWIKDNGIKKVLVAGSTGEGVGLSKKDFIELSAKVEQVGLKQVLCVVNPNPNKVIEIAQEVSAEEIMLVPPVTTKAEQQDILLYFQTIATEISQKIFLYNNSTRFGLNIEFDTYEQIIQTGRVSGVKECADPDNKIWDQLNKLQQQCSFSLYVGDDVNWIGISERIEVDGCVSVVANCFPGQSVELANDLSQNKTVNETKWQSLCDMLPIAKTPLQVKYVLNQRGLMGDKTMMNFTELTQEQKEKLNIFAIL